MRVGMDREWEMGSSVMILWVGARLYSCARLNGDNVGFVMYSLRNSIETCNWR
jgi:hypothetical protein